MMSEYVDSHRIVRRQCGGWLGLYAASDGLSVGVTGQSEQQTMTLLEHAVERWRYLLESETREGDTNDGQEIKG